MPCGCRGVEKVKHQAVKYSRLKEKRAIQFDECLPMWNGVGVPEIS